MTADPARISVTAKVSAYYRSFSDIAFAAEVATLIGADEAFAEIVRNHGLEPDKLAFYARSVCYVETDLRDVVATKVDLLEELRLGHGVAPSPLHVVTVADALDIGQLRTAAAVFERDRPLMVLCEGLVGYLTREEAERLAENVRMLIGELGGGWWIVPDFAFKAELRNLPPERIRLREAITGVTQRQLDAAAFEDAADLEAFLRRVGFDMQVFGQVDETPSFSTIAALGLSAAVIDRIRPLLRVWVMTPVARDEASVS